VAEVALVSDVPAAGSLAEYLAACGLPVRPAYRDGVPDVAGADVVLALCDRPPAGLLDRLAGGGPTLLLGPTLAAWRDVEEIDDLVGVLPGRLTPEHEVRVRPGPQAGELAARLDPEQLVRRDRVLTVDKVHDDTAVLLTASVAHAEHPVATRHGAVATLTLGWTAGTVQDRWYQRLAFRLLRVLLGQSDGPPVGVGLLGFGAIGAEHLAAAEAVAGLRPAAVCDRSAERLAAARQQFPDVAGYSAADDLLADDAVDLIVVSTPPDTHARWSVRALAAGKSVVVEKPFCLTVAEADEQLAAAARAGRRLAVYQSRRWDPDFLALKHVVSSGQIGEVFHYESFVGGYGHPCNYWHSEESVSGGAIYDWGAHYLDWALDLMHRPVEWVSATAHKRVWHDVTNADHTRVLLHFADGAEATFTHSDLAAALPPKWHVLGTAGAVVGSWRRERVVQRDRVGALAEERLAPADSPARLDVYAPDGSVTRLALPIRPPYAFHRELADHLLTGAPLSVTAEDARRTVAVMQAATASVRAGGRPVGLPQ